MKFREKKKNNFIAGIFNVIFMDSAFVDIATLRVETTVLKHSIKGIS